MSKKDYRQEEALIELKHKKHMIELEYQRKNIIQRHNLDMEMFRIKNAEYKKAQFRKEQFEEKKKGGH